MAGKFNIKCGVINPDGQINQDIGFKFFTWTATSNSEVENQVTLAERVRDLYPEMTEPYQIVCIDETNERVVLQADDFKETIAAFLCLKSKNDKPVRICIQPLSFIQSALSDDQGHYGVVCSGCHRRPIIGFRYDCTQCPNFVLCARCQSAGVHREHNFVRISQPPTLSLNPQDKQRYGVPAGIVPSLHETVQQLGDRIIHQMNSFQSSITNAIHDLTETLYDHNEHKPHSENLEKNSGKVSNK